MKIAVSVMVDLDANKWAEYNGVEHREVRDDVRTHVLNLIQQSVLIDEADGDVTLRRPRSTS